MDAAYQPGGLHLFHHLHRVLLVREGAEGTAELDVLFA